MKNIHFITSVCLMTLLIALAAGCVTESGQRSKLMAGIPDDGKTEYKKVNSGNLELRLMSIPKVYAGRDAFLTFALSNIGNRKIGIPEWLSNESDNIVLYVQPWLTNMNAPDPDSWTKLSFDRKKPVFHYPLTLMPGNKALINKELGFIKNIRLAPGQERRYFLRAESTLDSLEISTPVIPLIVVPVQNLK